MSAIKKAVNFIRKIVEEYCTGIAFIVMLVTMIYGVFMRYVFNSPITWGLELQSICFVSLVFLGVGLSEHHGETVSFEMIYNLFSKRTQNIFRILSNLLTIVFIGIMFSSSAVYVFSMTNTTTVLEVPRNIVFTPYIIMLFTFIVRHTIWLIDDIKGLVNGTLESQYLITQEKAKQKEREEQQ